MGILLWETISNKVNSVKSDINIKIRDVATKKEIKKINEELYKNKVFSPVKATTTGELKYLIEVKSALIHIEDELYDILKNKSLERNLKKGMKKISNVGGTVGTVTGVITGFISPYTIPLLLTSLFLGVISKSEFDKYDYEVEEYNNRIILKRKK